MTGATDAAHVPDAAVDSGVAALTGDVEQVPTAVSAIKVAGRRAYDLAREGVEVELAARPVTIREFRVTGRRRPVVDGLTAVDLDVVVRCTSGTYVRALARDLGAALGVGGHLTALRRTEVGPFSVEGAPVPERDTDVAASLLPPVDVAARLFPVWRMDAAQAVDLGHGKRVASGLDDTDGPVAAVTPEGRLAGLVAVRRGTAKPIVNFPSDEVAP